MILYTNANDPRGIFSDIYNGINEPFLTVPCNEIQGTVSSFSIWIKNIDDPEYLYNLTLGGNFEIEQPETSTDTVHINTSPDFEKYTFNFEPVQCTEENASIYLYLDIQPLTENVLGFEYTATMPVIEIGGTANEQEIPVPIATALNLILLSIFLMGIYKLWNVLKK